MLLLQDIAVRLCSAVAETQNVRVNNGGRNCYSMLNADGRKNLNKDNSGAALAMVIIIIAFISILAAVLMFVAYAGFRMRLVDRQGKDTFYTAETVLDEINVGLQGEISAALSVAYEDVMINYSLENSANARNKRFRETYFNKLTENLQDPVNTGTYNIGKLRGYLSPESLGDGNATREGFHSYGAIVESNVEGGAVQYVLEANYTRMLLKDLKVSYVNENGYVSIISTDIRIDLPSFNFSQASALPALESCSLIADDTLFIGNATSGGSVTVKGDAYAGQMIVGTPEGTVLSALSDGNPVTGETVTPVLPTDVSVLLSTDVGFENPVDTNAEGLSLVISRKIIDVGEGSSLNTKGAELWAQNLILDSAEVDLDGAVNLKDDLTLSGSNSTAVLKGEYTGFGYYAEPSDAESGGAGDDEDDGDSGIDPYRSPDASSAIVINGRESTLDLSGLQRMTISGRAYVATAYNSKTDTSATEEEKDNNKSNIMMGESVAVKSNQMIYLVPGEALGCRIEKDGTVGDSEYGCNPLTLEQYNEIRYDHPEKYVFLNGDKPIAELGYMPLKNYIDQEDVAGGEPAYMPEVIFSQTNAGPLVYCYLRFSSVEKADQYFRDYYDVNAESVDRYTQLYAKDIKMLDDRLYLHIAGNMLVYEGEEKWSVVSSLDSDGTTVQANKISNIKGEEFNSLSVKLVRTANQLTDAELGRTAFPNIIDELEVENVLDAKGRVNEVTFETEDGSAAMVLTKPKDAGQPNDYIVDNNTPANVKIIVSLGNVLVNRDFQGLIIAKGNITVAAGAHVTLEPLDVNTLSDLLRIKVVELSPPTEGHPNDYYLMNVFSDGLNYAYSGNVAFEEQSARISMVDLISYERWTKK